jgi:hypothetical protein
MPLSFQILPSRQLVVVTYEGIAGIDETHEALERYAAHPDFRPDQKTLFDLTRVTGHERDFVRMFRLQAQMVEIYGVSGHDQHVGFIAPTRAAYDMAMLARVSWEPVKHMIILIHPEAAEVLHFLGQPESSIAELLAAAAPG